MSIADKLTQVAQNVPLVHQAGYEKGFTDGKVDIALQEKTVTPDTVSKSVTPDSGYDGLSKVTVEAVEVVEQATPSISVNSDGLITASVTQSTGYVKSGNKQSTRQLEKQPARSITPSKSSQTAVVAGRYTTGAVTVEPIPDSYVEPVRIVSGESVTYTPTTSNQVIMEAGTYCTGAQIIKGDANLVSENIKSGVSIFGVSGNYEASTPAYNTLYINTAAPAAPDGVDGDVWIVRS